MTENSFIPPRREAVRLKRARKLSPSSQRWLNRQLNDPYVAAAKSAGYRSRAAFKMIELDDKYQAHQQGRARGRSRRRPRRLEPGGAATRGREGDRHRPAADHPRRRRGIHQGDFTAEGMDVRLTAMLGGKADLVLSDMAPNTTGHVATDHIRIMALAEMALAFACEILTPEGAFVAKLFQGGAERDMLNMLKLQFRNVRHAKPPASRKDSKEMYVVATGFRGRE